MSRPAVVTIGNFDGLHAGHRSIVRRVVALAQERGWTAAAVTFDPHPTRLVAPDRAPRLLTTPEQRAALMRAAGIQQVVVLPFTKELACLSPEEFVKRILVDRLNARMVLVGDSFRFGHRAEGHTDTLRELGSKYGFDVETVSAVERRGRVCSSSEVRRLVQSGDVSKACRLLERPFALEGRVVPGHGVGSKQTVPTLNLETQSEVLPATGVYITRTADLQWANDLQEDDLQADRRWPSITNVGYRPTFNGNSLTIETFLLSPLTGDPPAKIRVEFLRRVRDERKFENPAALKAQILHDVARAQTYFRRTGGTTEECDT
jgi:riboflavin kinase/FMN adenylyltransferase